MKNMLSHSLPFLFRVKPTALPALRLFATKATKPFPVMQLKEQIDTRTPEYTHSENRGRELMSQYEELLKICKLGGGEKGITRHTKKNKKILPRERVSRLLDEGTPFMELSAIAGMGMEYGNVPSAAMICGIGQIHGRYCLLLANDATHKGGTIFPISVKKMYQAQYIATVNKIPCIYLVDSGGAFLPLQSEIFPDAKRGGRMFFNEGVLGASGVPQISLVCGSCTAGGAYMPTMTDQSIMVNQISTMFLGGPPLVKAATGEVVTEENLGGALLHCQTSGCADYFAGTEDEAFEMCRDIVASLNIAPAEEQVEYDHPLYGQDDLIKLSGVSVLRKNHMYIIISRLVDGSRFREFKTLFGRNLITGFGFMRGKLVGILANCGPLVAQDGSKGAHFVQYCNHQGIPLVFVQNSGGQHSDVEEDGLVLKERSKMVAAVSCATVPKLSVNVSSCYGDDLYTMCGPSFQPNFYFTWPNAVISMNRPGVFDMNVEKDDKPSKRSKFDFPQTSAFFAAANMISDGIIPPQETRKVLSQCLNIVPRSMPERLQATLRM